jgi:MerC mercury resistance protein
MVETDPQIPLSGGKRPEMSSRRQQLVWLPAGSTSGDLLLLRDPGHHHGLSLMGITLDVNGHVWAVVIVAFALIAVLGLALDYRQHESPGALALDIVGTLVVIFAIYGSRAILTLGVPRDAVEIVGFVGLIAATIWDWRMKKA